MLFTQENPLNITGGKDDLLISGLPYTTTTSSSTIISNGTASSSTDTLQSSPRKKHFHKNLEFQNQQLVDLKRENSSNESFLQFNDRKIKPILTHPDYIFLEEGLIAYLPERLGSILKEATYLFNLKPIIAKDFLISKKVISGSSAEFADFIFYHSKNQSKLSKRRIGEFVGQLNPYNQKVLELYLMKFDFSGMTLDDAIRSLVKQFRLPGEAQQIDRILEIFAGVYFKQNNSIKGMYNTAIKSADVAYILSFSILMLNTDLHNPSIPLKKKMLLQEFIRNNRGINNGLDLPYEQLEAVYINIKNNEIKTKAADMLESNVPAFMAPTMAGYLLKSYHVAMVPMWKKRWFILNDGCLYYFNKPYESNPKCIMPLDNIHIERPRSNMFHSGSNENNSVTTDISRSDIPASRRFSTGSTTNHSYKVGDNDRTLIISAVNGGFLKSSKLSRTGSMKSVPRSKLVLKAYDLAERDSWFIALQGESKTFEQIISDKSFGPSPFSSPCPSRSNSGSLISSSVEGNSDSSLKFMIPSISSLLSSPSGTIDNRDFSNLSVTRGRDDISISSNVRKVDKSESPDNDNDDCKSNENGEYFCKSLSLSVDNYDTERRKIPAAKRRNSARSSASYISDTSSQCSESTLHTDEFSLAGSKSEILLEGYIWRYTSEETLTKFSERSFEMKPFGLSLSEEKEKFHDDFDVYRRRHSEGNVDDKKEKNRRFSDGPFMESTINNSKNPDISNAGSRDEMEDKKEVEISHSVTESMIDQKLNSNSDDIIKNSDRGDSDDAEKNDDINNRDLKAINDQKNGDNEVVNKEELKLDSNRNKKKSLISLLSLKESINSINSSSSLSKCHSYPYQKSFTSYDLNAENIRLKAEESYKTVHSSAGKITGGIAMSGRSRISSRIGFDGISMRRKSVNGSSSPREITSPFHTTNSRRMYLVIYRDIDGDGDTLFYFPNEEAAFSMRNTGAQTQQGYLRMSCVQSIKISTDERISSINIFTQDKVLSFTLDDSSQDIYLWVDLLRYCTDNSRKKTGTYCV